MATCRKKVNISLIIVLLSIAVSCYPFYSVWSGTQSNMHLQVIHKQNTDTVPLFEVFEIKFKHEPRYVNPFLDVTIDVVFTSPGGELLHVGGFFYSSQDESRILDHELYSSSQYNLFKSFKYKGYKGDTWKVRFVPGEIGHWTYEYTFSDKYGYKATGKGSFTCLKGRKRNRGFVRISPTNPFHFLFDDGSPFFPIGIQDCWGDKLKNGTVLDSVAMEGPFRTEVEEKWYRFWTYFKKPPPLPAGTLYIRGPSSNPQNADVYFRHFAQSGFNLFRFSQKNCSYSLYRDLDHYNKEEGIMTDELLVYARKYGFKILYGIFGYQKVFNHNTENQEGMAKIKRFIKYSVDRWGAYVDMWEFLNEQKADTKWYKIMIPYLKSIDPYNHPVTTSWERPELTGIDINAPHWYIDGKELESDIITASKAKRWKKFEKPVIVGEHGNRINRQKKQQLGITGVWDNRSAIRMRIRNWVAFFNEIAFVFWNTSYARDGNHMNIWLGPKEREYVRAMQDFVYRLDKNIKIVPVNVSQPNDVRAYGLASKERAGIYLHHFSNHKSSIRGLKISLDIPKGVKGYWYSPENADIIKSVDLSKGIREFEAPEFYIDIALLITPDGPLDIDKDGVPNHLDHDDDNDGTPDLKDAFPLEPGEWEDKDSDLIGDNIDADDNADGLGDDENKNGIPDHEELDFDGDGVDRANTIPWDAFPLNMDEWCDSDGDGIGDNKDNDDDGDGWSDEEELKAKTGPLDKLSFPYGTKSP